MRSPRSPPLLEARRPRSGRIPTLHPPTDGPTRGSRQARSDHGPPLREPDGPVPVGHDPQGAPGDKEQEPGERHTEAPVDPRRARRVLVGRAVELQVGHAGHVGGLGAGLAGCREARALLAARLFDRDLLLHGDADRCDAEIQGECHAGDRHEGAEAPQYNDRSKGSVVAGGLSCRLNSNGHQPPRPAGWARRAISSADVVTAATASNSAPLAAGGRTKNDPPSARARTATSSRAASPSASMAVTSLMSTTRSMSGSMAASAASRHAPIIGPLSEPRRPIVRRPAPRPELMRSPTLVVVTELPPSSGV